MPIYTWQWRLPFPALFYPIDLDSVSRVNARFPIFYNVIYFQNIPLFLVAYVLQGFGQLLVGCFFPGFSGMMLTFSFLICSQYDLLFCSLKNIRYTAMLMSNINNRRKLKCVLFYLYF